MAIYVINHLPEWLAEAALGGENPNESLYRRLRDRAGVEPYGGRRTLQAIAVEGRRAKLLDLDVGAPVAFIQSVARDESMRSFDTYQAWLGTDRTSIDVGVSGAGALSQPLPAAAEVTP